MCKSKVVFGCEIACNVILLSNISGALRDKLWLMTMLRGFMLDKPSAKYIMTTIYL